MINPFFYMTNLHRHWFWILSCASFATLLLANCTALENVHSSTPDNNTSSDTMEAGEETKGVATNPSFTQFLDLPIPDTAVMVLNKTQIFGSASVWYGRLAVHTDHKLSTAFNFYKEKMPQFGWQEITIIRSVQSIMIYQRQDRIATIQIDAAALSGSDIVITITPHETQGNAASTKSPAVWPPAAINQSQPN